MVGHRSRSQGSFPPEGLRTPENVTLKDGPWARVRFGAAGVVGMASSSARGNALERLALIGPFEGLGHGAVEVIHKGLQFLLEIGQGGQTKCRSGSSKRRVLGCNKTEFDGWDHSESGRGFPGLADSGRTRRGFSPPFADRAWR